MCFKLKSVQAQTRSRSQTNQNEVRMAQTSQGDRGAERNVEEDYKRYVRFTREELKLNQHYTLDLYLKLMSAIGKQPTIDNYRLNLSAMNFIVAEHSHKDFLRDFSPQYNERRQEFFMQFYCLPNLFHPV